MSNYLYDFSVQGVVRKLTKRIEQAHPGVALTNVNAERFFGLQEPFLRRKIESLEHASICGDRYRFLFGQQPALDDVERQQEQSSSHLWQHTTNSCARCEGFSREKIRQMKQKNNALVMLTTTPQSNTDNTLSDQAPVASGRGTSGKGRRRAAVMALRRDSGRASQSATLPDRMQYREMKSANATHQRIAVCRSAIHGLGLMALVPITRGEMIVEYVGEVIRQSLADLREKHYDDNGIGCYMFRIDDEWIIDATKRGNMARYVNHSCSPNAATRIISDSQSLIGKRIVIVAKKDIASGEEILYDYQFP
eukprot:CAMPEP_0201557870 /NCGR_PEP_ID=MMETSP0173_2-20130828/64350_1 /ASSEMBLY_ACC=CAM_ASM_000268 /TAXON_ID=218659 /ORGANISM="Vexillifera sp., Strain DIVA3 564/2" /LENGTH=307 /DNA_ID=CAMNT_0047970935 /DNA_START=277 /DNA_END=1197 /DNA_ORIENTATION=+